MIKISAPDSNSGPELRQIVELSPGITVVTGKNGSGKTRLLELIENRSELLEGTLRVYAKRFSQESLSPSFGDINQAASLQTRQDESINAFLADPFSYSLPPAPGRRMQNAQGIGHEGIRRICLAIMESTEKAPSEITGDDFRAYWIEPNGEFFGSQDLAKLFNTYIKRKHDIQYACFEAFLRSDEHELTRSSLAGLHSDAKAPWELLNEVLDRVLGGKFYFAPPDESLRVFNQRARLFERGGGELSVASLSSGEKTLMWLALTIFNSQCFEDSSSLVPKLLLLDEPDAFLHPHMVVKLYETLDILVEQFRIYVLIVTHSPTTVALAPGKIFQLQDGKLLSQDKDSAISGLLDGVTQISVDPENRRQVFVESVKDAEIYQLLFSVIAGSHFLVDAKISLSFIPAGRKTEDELLKNCVFKIFGEQSSDQVELFIKMVNGGGDCSQVSTYVKALSESKTVRGIVDWDRRHTTRPKGVVVSAQDYAYTIENLLLDPICILQMARQMDPTKYSVLKLCEVDVADPDEWFNNDQLMQLSIDKYLLNILGRASAGDAVLQYLGGREFKTDQEYLKMDGKELEKSVLEKYPELLGYKKNHGFLYGVAKQMKVKGWKYVPTEFARTFAQLQK
ncbi:AAA family ATPase [Pseudomonas sp. NPDC078416]|uniref:AAA family ATPase n=1 Tax=Pseudomonas sp. NPDC078416 TaxID=3390637 RepID=UPI003D060EF2